jgi:hypothetical protein
VDALAQFMFLKPGHGAEMLAHPRQRLREMHAARQMFGEQVLKVAEQRTGLGISGKRLGLRFGLDPFGDPFERLKTFRNGDARRVWKCRDRQWTRLPHRAL